MGAGHGRSRKIASERRIITILSVDIAGSTRHIAACDPDDAQTFFDRCFDHMRVMIGRAGGTMVSFEGDGGIAAFGWPDALEDHADRACLAAWGIQHDGQVGMGPSGRHVQFRVGLHSGLVALRQVRRGGRSRLDTVGATVHVAAKLQQSAPPGSVVLSAEVARLCRNRIELVAHATTTALDGVDEAWRLEARPKRDEGPLALEGQGPLIGRESEQAVLASVLSRSGGPARTVAIVGEPGIGKSRLAAAALEDASAGGAATFLFFGDAQTRTTPFAAARSLLRGAAADRPAERLVSADRAALAAAGLDEAEIGTVEALLRPRSGGRSKGSGLTDTRLARLYARAFAALAPARPGLLLVEDLHLVDPESRLFLRMLAQTPTTQPLGLLITARPEARTAAREIASDLVELEPLARANMVRLAGSIWPDADVRLPEIDRLVDRAEGIPFVLVELVHTVRTRNGGNGHDLPATVESLVHARLQRLSPGSRGIAQALSLLGENVDLALARAVTGLDSGALLDGLEELERFAFVHPSREGHIRMRHRIIAEACADTIPREKKRRLHRAAAKAIPALDPSLDGRHEQLAFHAEAAGDDRAALDHLWEAALEARRSSATASLALLFDRAMGLVDRIGEEAEERYVDFVLTTFASMLQLGEFARMNVHLPRVMEIVRRRGEPARICSTLSQLGMICWFEGRYEEGLEASEEALGIARDLESPALIFSSQLMLANNLHGLGRAGRAVEEGRRLCDLLGGELETARLGAAGLPKSMALAFLSWFLMDAGAYEEGLVHVERALALAQREKDPYGEVLARHGLAHNLLMLHRNEEALEHLAVAREISERDGYDAIRPNLIARLATALARTGRAAEAVALVEEALRAEVHRRGGRMEHYHLLAAHAEALVLGGDSKRGLAVLEEALAIARAIRNPCLLVHGLGLRSRTLAGRNPADPRAAADRAERDALCIEHGLTAWAPVSAVESRPPLRS